MNIHFIAIGGSVMHQLAIALHLKGYHVTGSDDDIFNPSHANLQYHDLLPKSMGWDTTKITTNLDAVILGMHAKPDNPELLAAKNLQIPIYSYPEYIYKQAQEKQRIVISGSHGKTTITAMIMHVLKHWAYDFDYLVGAKLEGFEYSVRITDAPIMILEGDEYLSSPIHRQPKIHFYKPQVTLLSGIAWDHINVFPTFENYVEQFRYFLKTMPKDATLVYNQEDLVVKQLAEASNHLKLKAYETPTYQYDEASIYITHKQVNYHLQIFGKHNLQNLMGAKDICQAIGLTAEQFYEAIQHFAGAARRLELVAKNEQSVIYKDFAHAPSKVLATTNALKERYPKRTLTACLELHTYSSLNKTFLTQYQKALNAGDQAVVFYNEHTFKIKRLSPLLASDVQAAFQHPNLKVFTNSADLQAWLTAQNFEEHNLLMMSSGNFGGLDLKNMATILLEK